MDNLREYEFTLISRADVSENETNELLSKYEAYMTADGGEILKKDVWGSKKLAFNINKNYRGHYCLYDIVSNPDQIKEMQRLMKIDENVLRTLAVKLRDNVDVDQRKAELAKEPTPVE